MSVSVTTEAPTWPRAVKIVSVDTPPKRLRLLSAVVEAVCEIMALGMEAGRAGVASRQADALHDRHLETVRRLAMRGAEESSAIHGCPCWRRFMAIDHHGGAAQQHDAAEDSLIARMVSGVQRVVQIGRGINRRLELEISKRGGRHGQ